MEQSNKYDKLDGLRAYAALGIIMMHVLANGGYALDGFLFDRLIPSFTDLVFLFMVISGFSMCCGYYDKIANAEITPAQFYSKRFKKVWPFFAVLCLLELCVSPSVNALYETIANLTLCFGLLPNADISVIGVGWFLGLVFVFYMIFPFYCFLLQNRKRAWCVFGVSILLNWLCVVRFDAGRSNIMYSAMYFIAGGMIYLYRKQLYDWVQKAGILLLAGILLVTVLYFAVRGNEFVLLLWCTVVTVYALGNTNGKCTFLSNAFTRKVSSISLELYLSHMVIFRVLEKLRLVKCFESDVFAYFLAVVLTMLGTFVFAYALRWCLSKSSKLISKMKTMIGL